MRAVITSFGSTGDIVPFVALASELQHRGHNPVLALSPNLSDWAERYGLEFHPVGLDLHEAQQAINLVDLTGHKRGRIDRWQRSASQQLAERELPPNVYPVDYVFTFLVIPTGGLCSSSRRRGNSRCCYSRGRAQHNRPA